MNDIFNNQVKDPVTIVIFGASGDLTQRKLIPALFSAYQKNYYLKNFQLLVLLEENMMIINLGIS